MKLPYLRTALLGTALLASTIALMPASAMAGNKGRMYRVTIQDATLGQPLSPPVIATHDAEFHLFDLGEAPMMGDDGYDQYFGLAAVAETGYADLLFDAVSAADGVWDVVVLPPVLGPGESNSVEISASGNAKYLSVASMLGKTNDGFWALRGVALPRGIGDTARYFANGYDAGSEANAESDATVGRGDDEDNPDDNPEDDGYGINDGSGEGYIFVHAGIQGVGDLDAATYDWRDPVVEVIIERIK